MFPLLGIIKLLWNIISSLLSVVLKVKYGLDPSVITNADAKLSGILILLFPVVPVKLIPPDVVKEVNVPAAGVFAPIIPSILVAVTVPIVAVP